MSIILSQLWFMVPQLFTLYLGISWYESGQIRSNSWTTFIGFVLWHDSQSMTSELMVGRFGGKKKKTQWCDFMSPRILPSGWWPATCQWKLPCRYYQLYRWCCPGKQGWLWRICRNRPKVSCGTGSVTLKPYEYKDPIDKELVFIVHIVFHV